MSTGSARKPASPLVIHCNMLWLLNFGRFQRHLWQGFCLSARRIYND